MISYTQFEKLSFEEKKLYLSKAKKIAEVSDDSSKAELYVLGNIYIEAIVSFVEKIRKTVHACDHIPAIFRKQLYDLSPTSFRSYSY